MKKLIAVLFLCSAAASGQSLSPFAPPPFSSNPGTCYVGQIINNTSANALQYCIVTNVWVPLVAGPNTATIVGNIPTWSSIVGGGLNPGLPVSSTLLGSAVVESTAGGTIDVSFMPAYFPGIVPNDTVTGTVQFSLAVISSTGKAIKAAATDTAIPIFVVTSATSTSGNATLAKVGQATCTFDTAGGTIKHFVVASTATAGRCMDAGAGAPSSGWVIGQLLTTAASNGTGTVDLDAGYYSASGGGSVTSIGFTTPTNGFTFSSSTTNPITSTGTITLGFSNENAGVAFLGPCTGSATTPAWRAFCVQDLPGAVNTVSFSATPTFDLSLGGVQTITLTGNVTSSSISNGVAGKHYVFIVCQDGTGGRTLVWPGTFHGTMTVGSTLSICSAQAFDALTSTALYASAPGVINQ